MTIGKTIALCVCMALMLAVSVGALAAQPAPKGQLVFSSSNFAPYSTASFSGFEDLMTKEIFRRLGYSVTIRRQPSQRSLINLNEGIDDGTLSRIGGLNKAYPNIVQFSEKLIVDQYVAFSAEKNLKISGWESLEPHHVAFINGWKIFERNVKKARSITMVKDISQLFRLIERGRADVVLTLRWAGLQIIEDMGLSAIHVVEPPLAEKDKFLYLHARHRELVPRASAVLREIKRDGTYQRIYDETFGRLVASSLRRQAEWPCN